MNTTAKGITEKVQTALLSIATTGIFGCCAFLWSVNAALVKLQERDTENVRVREELNTRMNNVQLDIRDIRDRLIRVESKQPK